MTSSLLWLVLLCTCTYMYSVAKSKGRLLCSESPCLNGGRCVPKAPGEDVMDYCDCAPFWFGDFCQAQPCVPNPCQNEGVCTEVVATAGYKCNCTAGFNGHQCQYHPCDPDPCRNGTCTLLARTNQRECKCDVGYHGRNCQLQIPSPCPCTNGGNCTLRHDSRTNRQGFYHMCNCPAGFCGPICNLTDPCLNNGTCINKYWVTEGFCCNCTLDRDGRLCQGKSICQDADYCRNGGTCNPRAATCLRGYIDVSKCICDRVHWIGARCDIRNPCQDSPCFAKGTRRCVGRTAKTYTCQCKWQWGGVLCDEEYAAHCMVYDDPHMVTFDGSYYEHHSDCRVVAAKTCSNRWPAQVIPTIQVLMENRKLSPGKFGRAGLTLVDTIQLEIYETDIRINRNLGVQVNLRDGNGFVPVAHLPWPTDAMNPPLPKQETYPIFIQADPADPLGRLNIKFTADKTRFMYVYFGRGAIGIYLSHALAQQVKGKMCGACGLFDYKSANDFAGKSRPNDAFVSGQLQRPIVPPGCSPILDPSVAHQATSGTKPAAPADFCSNETRAAAQKACSILNDPKGPFGACLARNTHRNAMFAGCVNDICSSPGFLEVTLAGYAAQCGRFGQFGDWRAVTGLPMKCLPNQHYSACMSRSCLPTSDSLDPCPEIPGANLRAQCEEGCVCDEPFIWDQVSASCITRDAINTTSYSFPLGFKLFDGKYDAIVSRCENSSENEMPACTKGGYCFEVGAILTHKDCHSFCICTLSGTGGDGKTLHEPDDVPEEKMRATWECGCYSDASPMGPTTEEREEMQTLCHDCDNSTSGDCGRVVYAEKLDCLHILHTRRSKQDDDDGGVDAVKIGRVDSEEEKGKGSIRRELLITRESEHVLDVCSPYHNGTNLSLAEGRYHIQRCHNWSFAKPYCRKEGYCFATGSKIASEACETVCTCLSTQCGSKATWKCASAKGKEEGNATSEHGRMNGKPGGAEERNNGTKRGAHRGLSQCHLCRQSAADCGRMKMVEAMAACLTPRQQHAHVDYGTALLTVSSEAPSLYDFCERDEQG